MTLLTTLELLGTLSLLLGLLLGYASVRFKVEGNPVVDQVNAILPQSQCGKCGYPGCRPYAEAVVSGEAEINLCSPGGESTLLALSSLLGRPIPKSQLSSPIEDNPPKVALIDESNCVGCTLCIQVCPVDAIVGAPKWLHTVITQECTGCELCPPVCPVTCIHMVNLPPSLSTWKWPFPSIKYNI